MDDIFRAFFGLPRRSNPYSGSPSDRDVPFDPPHSSGPFDSEDGDVEDDDGDFFPFGHVDIFTQPSDIFHQFDEMFAKFDDIFRGFSIPSTDPNPGESILIPSLPSPPEGPSISPRDRMLKQPDTVPVQPPAWRDDGPRSGLFSRLWGNRVLDTNRDADLDESVKSGGIDAIFGDTVEPESRSIAPFKPNHNVFRSVSVQTRRMPDGKVEERQTMVDGGGNEQTIVSRTFNGQTVRQTTKRNKTGEVEVIEDLINMTEKDKDNFEKKWQEPAGRSSLYSNRSPQFQPRSDALRELDPETNDSSLFEKLFGFPFPGSRNG